MSIMSNNTNLFYQLYSTSGAVAQSGFTCTSAVDETQTSFDITGSSSNGASGVITDSNGNPLGSISLNDLHADGISQYNSETRILQPWSCCLLQGQEYGLACASYYYHIPARIHSINNYESFCSVDFDVIYNNFDPQIFHIHVDADGESSFVDAINEELDSFNVEVSVSIQEIYDAEDCCGHEYLVFLSQKEGYFYYITNLRLLPAFQSEKYPDSPFSKSLSDLRVVILELIEQFHPIKKSELPDECDCDCDDSCEACHPTYEFDEDSYEVDCTLYKWILNNYQDAVNHLNDFKKVIELLRTINNDTEDKEIDEILEEANSMIVNTPYDSDIINEYDLDNMEVIASIIESIKAMIEESNEYYQDMYWLLECKRLRVPLMRYPNGAFRGIVLIPDWPAKNADNYQYSSLWVNHVKSTVKLYRPTIEGQFLPKIYGVMSNATLVHEQTEYKRTNPNFTGVQSNEGFCRCVQDGWNDTLSTNYMNPYRPEYSNMEDIVYMGQNCYANKKSIIGLYRYMQYVNENQLWNKVGQGYMIIGNEDDPQSKERNLPTSLLVYNPNPFPVRIKYMIFS